MTGAWTPERIEAFHTANEDGFSEIEPGLRASRPVVRLTPSERRCTHAYHTTSPLSADGAKLVYFDYDELQVGRRLGRPITGTVVVADADGSNRQPLAHVKNASVNSGVMQQWVGPTRRVGFVNFGAPPSWRVMDVDTGEGWHGDGQAREFAPEGTDLFLQTPEDIHMVAEDQGRHLAPDEVAARIIDWRTGQERARVSVAHVLAVHPEADDAARQHMCFKQTLFSPDGKRISFNFSNSWYSEHRGTERRRHEKCVADRDGTNLLCLGAGASHPSWHPGGQYYFAVAADEHGVPRFMLYPVDGSAPEPVGPDWIAAGHPAFQPGEARYLAVDTPAPHKGHVFLRLYDLRETTYEDILVAEYTDYSNDSGTHFHPAWSRDGKHVFIASAHSGVAHLYRVDV